MAVEPIRPCAIRDGLEESSGAKLVSTAAWIDLALFVSGCGSRAASPRNGRHTGRPTCTSFVGQPRDALSDITTSLA